LTSALAITDVSLSVVTLPAAMSAYVHLDISYRPTSKPAQVSLSLLLSLLTFYRWLMLGLETLGTSRCLNHW